MLLGTTRMQCRRSLASELPISAAGRLISKRKCVRASNRWKPHLAAWPMRRGVQSRRIVDHDRRAEQATVASARRGVDLLHASRRLGLLAYQHRDDRSKGISAGHHWANGIAAGNGMATGEGRRRPGPDGSVGQVPARGSSAPERA